MTKEELIAQIMEQVDKLDNNGRLAFLQWLKELEQQGEN